MQLMNAFNTYDCHESCNSHSDNQKLRILNSKVNADFLQDTKVSIDLEPTKTLFTPNYDDALTILRNQVNQKFPPELSSSNNRRTRIFI